MRRAPVIQIHQARRTLWKPRCTCCPEKGCSCELHSVTWKKMNIWQNNLKLLYNFKYKIKFLQISWTETIENGLKRTWNPTPRSRFNRVALIATFSRETVWKPAILQNALLKKIKKRDKEKHESPSNTRLKVPLPIMFDFVSEYSIQNAWEMSQRKKNHNPKKVRNICQQLAANAITKTKSKNTRAQDIEPVLSCKEYKNKPPNTSAIGNSSSWLCSLFEQWTGVMESASFVVSILSIRGSNACTSSCIGERPIPRWNPTQKINKQPPCSPFQLQGLHSIQVHCHAYFSKHKMSSSWKVFQNEMEHFLSSLRSSTNKKWTIINTILAGSCYLKPVIIPNCILFDKLRFMGTTHVRRPFLLRFEPPLWLFLSDTVCAMYGRKTIRKFQAYCLLMFLCRKNRHAHPQEAASDHLRGSVPWWRYGRQEGLQCRQALRGWYPQPLRDQGHAGIFLFESSRWLNLYFLVPEVPRICCWEVRVAPLLLVPLWWGYHLLEVSKFDC